MERVAIIEISELGTNLVIFETKNSRYNFIKQFSDKFDIGKEIEEQKLLNPNTISRVVSIMKMYRDVIQDCGATKTIAFATGMLAKARNQRGFVEEVYNNTGISIQISDEEDEIRNLYLANMNAIDVSKGYMIHVGSHSTKFIKFNRRTTLGSFSIPYGCVNVLQKGSTQRSFDDIVELVSKSIADNELIKGCEEDGFIGSGDSFINLGRLAKKVEHYPLDLDNNYIVSKDTEKKVVDFIKSVDTEKIKKVKGLVGDSSEVLLSSLAIIHAFYKTAKINSLAISTASYIDGYVLSNVVGEPQEKFTDLLGNSLDNYCEFRKNDISNNVRVANMAGILFKQLKVMHKLPRLYIKPMRIAAQMYDCGKNIGFNNIEKNGFNVILNSGVAGMSQKELLLASFVCLCQYPDNFSLSEWIKYKNILTDDDLDAVRKLGIIVRLAVALNSSKKQTIVDIVCDILGDSIIMKTIVSGDANYDILQGMKVAGDYRKIFKKNLQII